MTIFLVLGKIDNEFDQRLMKSFLEKLFVPGSFDGDFSLAKAQPNTIITIFIISRLENSNRGDIELLRLFKYSQVFDW